MHETQSEPQVAFKDETTIKASVCALCGTSENPTYTMEAFASTYMSACFHEACAACLGDHIERQLYSSCEEGCIRIKCFDKTCRKSMPQMLVRQASAVARWAMEEFDAGVDIACQTWLAACEAKLAQERKIRMGSSARHLGSSKLYPGVDGPLATCAICCKEARALVQVCRSQHRACVACAKMWGESHTAQIIALKTIDSIPCLFAPFCCEPLLADLLINISEEVRSLSKLLARRKALQDNVLFPSSCQVDCINPQCVGIGYLGYDTVMCFLCESQWVPEHPPATDHDIETMDLCLSFLDKDDVLRGLKRCPSCQVRIFKDGGCDHMTCSRCKHEWWWSTGNPYRLQT